MLPCCLCQSSVAVQAECCFTFKTDLHVFLGKYERKSPPLAYSVISVCICMGWFMSMCAFACVSDPVIVWKKEQWHSCARSSRWLWKPNPKPSLTGTQSAGNVECCCLPPETPARIGLLFQSSSGQ